MTVATPKLPDPPKLRLYSYARSSASWRARIGLALKRLSYEYVPVHLVQAGGQQRAPEYSAKNPMEQVPTLEIVRPSGVQRISQSIAILEWLEDYYPALPILPSDPYLRARARMLAELVNSGIQPFQNLSVTDHVKTALGADDKAWTKHFVGKGMLALERAARETAGRFAVGDFPTFADVCIVPQMASARRFGVDVTPLETLLRIEASCNALDAFAAAVPERQPDFEPAKG